MQKNIQGDTTEVFSLTVGTGEDRATSSNIKQKTNKFRWETNFKHWGKVTSDCSGLSIIQCSTLTHTLDF